MKRLVISTIAAAALVFAVPASAQTVPAGATAQCKDGTYSTAKSSRGACSGHGGVARAVRSESKSAPKRQSPTVATTGARDATAQCKDGSYSSASSKRGACSGHGGIKTWYADSAPAAPSAPRREPTASAPHPAAPPPPPVAPRTTTQSSSRERPANSPADATAQCNDGTYSYARQHRGACSGHHGVKTWFR